MLYDSMNHIKDLVHPVTIGKINGVYGVLGWIRLVSFTDQSDNIFNYNPWFIYLKYRWKLISLEKWRFLKKRSYIVKIQDISDRESAGLLMHCLIVIDAMQLPCLQDDEYYYKDLMGCIVMTDQKVCLGHVIDIIDTNAHDVLVVQKNIKDSFNKIKENLIPFIQDKIIKMVNINDRIIVVDWNFDS